MVAGGAGFIGYHLVKKLLNAEHVVIVLDNFACCNKDNLAEFAGNERLYLVEHDITKNFSIEGHLDAIINLASVPSPAYYYRMPYETLQTGLIGTKNLLEVAQKKGARFIAASTSEVYGDPLVHPQTEEYPGNVDCLGKRSQYDQSKRGGETLLKLYFDQYNLDIRIARIFNTYGPHMMFHDGRVVTNFIAAVINNEPLKMYGDGMQTRSFGYVSDTVDGLFRLLQNQELATEKVITNRVFNIGTPYEITINELANEIKNLCEQKLNKVIFLLYLPAIDTTDPKKRLPDIKRAKKMLGFDPQIKIKEGLKKTMSYFLEMEKPIKTV